MPICLRNEMAQQNAGAYFRRPRTAFGKCSALTGENMKSNKKIVAFTVVGIVIILLASFFWPLTQLRAQLLLNGSNVPLTVLVGMRLRGHGVREITDAHIALLKSGLSVPLDHLEALAAAGGDVPQCAKAMIEADKANLPIPFPTLAAVDLAAKAEGRSVLDMVRTIVNPRTLVCPPRGNAVPYIESVTKDGVSLRCRATLVVRATLEKYIGGTSEDALIAGVAEETAALIGQQSDSKAVLANPRRISDKIMASGVDARNMYQIQSVTVSLERNTLRGDPADYRSRRQRQAEHLCPRQAGRG